MGVSDRQHLRPVDLFLDNVELVLLAEDAPDDGGDFNDHIEGNGEEGARNEKGVPLQPYLPDGEGLEDAEDVHVEGGGGDEGRPEVAPVGGRQRVDAGEDQIEDGQRHGQPGVQGQAEEELHRQGNVPRVHHQVDALHPALPLLQKVRQREGRLLPHFALDEVEAVALAEGDHGKVAVLGHRPVEAIVEADVPLRLKLGHHE